MYSRLFFHRKNGGDSVRNCSNVVDIVCVLVFVLGGFPRGQLNEKGGLSLNHQKTRIGCWFVWYFFIIFANNSTCLVNQCRGVMDVKRISDGAQLVAKMLRIASSGEEIKIAQMLSEPERRQDAHNHAVPIVDYFLDDTDPEIAFLVMPLLRPFDDPPFASVDEVLDCIRQLLEVGITPRMIGMFDIQPNLRIQGLVYLHDLDVAHR